MFHTIKVMDGPKGAPRVSGGGNGQADPDRMGADSAAVPMDIPDRLLPVAPFDFALLPDSFRPWIQDMAERVHCPPDFPAAAAIVAAGSVLGCSVAIYPKCKDDWHEHANLWAMLAGGPGMLKTPALKAVMEPINRLAADALSQWQADNRDFVREKTVRKIRAEAAKAKAVQAAKGGKEFDVSPMLDAELEDEAPAPRRFTVNDASYEALCERCKENPGGVMLYQDELAGLLARVEDIPGLRELLLAAWSVQRNFAVDRIGRGVRYVSRVCLSVLGSIQPGKLAPLVRGAVGGGPRNDGLLQRFSVTVWPDSPAGDWANVDRWPDSAARDTAVATFQRLAGIRGDFGPDTQAREYRFAPEALEAFTSWRTDLERVLRSHELPEHLEGHRAKYRKLVPALALICALCDNPDPASVEVKLGALQKALGWERYLWSHANRLYGHGHNANGQTARLILQRIKKGEIAGTFTARDIYRKGWGGLTDTETVEAGCGFLVDLGWLTETESRGPAGGRPTFRFQLTEGAKAKLKL